MNCEILPYETNKSGYFPADTVSISILNAHNDQLSFLYGFYNLFAFECNCRDGVIYNVELDWECPKLCRKQIPRSIIHNVKNISFIDFIVSSIDEGYYVYVTLDSSKINCYHIENMDFVPHPLIIYGYNQAKQVFYIADYFNGVNYNSDVVSFSEMNIANDALLLQMKVLDSLCGTNDSILDIELIKYLKNCNIVIDKDYICHSISLFLEGRWVTGNAIGFIENRTLPRTAINNHGSYRYYEAITYNEKYGINVMKGIISHIENCISSDKYLFNFRHIHLINLYYELFIKKILVLMREIPSLNDNKQLNKILIDDNKHKKSLQLAVSLSIKYSVKKLRNLDAKDSLIKVNSIIKQEVQYINDISYLVRDILL